MSGGGSNLGTPGQVAGQSLSPPGLQWQPEPPRAPHPVPRPGNNSRGSLAPGSEGQTEQETKSPVVPPEPGRAGEEHRVSLRGRASPPPEADPSSHANSTANSKAKETSREEA